MGGGALYAAARERRYLDALRGPMGETLQYKRSGSMPVDAEGRTKGFTCAVPLGLSAPGPDPMLASEREAAIAAVRAWTAEPARLNGAPMVAPVTFQVKFGPR